MQLHKSEPILLFFLVLMLLGCNGEAGNSAKSFDPCDAVRDIDPHCDWNKEHAPFGIFRLDFPQKCGKHCGLSG